LGTRVTEDFLPNHTKVKLKLKIFLCKVEFFFKQSLDHNIMLEYC